MDSLSLNRALMSSGLWFGVTWAVSFAAGVDAPWVEIATDSAIMGASALASDTAHGLVAVPSSALTSAVATGAIYSGIQRLYRGDQSYVTNFLCAAGNDYLVEAWGSLLPPVA
jgi:hypothetical protein